MKDNEYTNEEKRLHKDCVTALAAAVIKQWILDGRPVRDIDSIKSWLAILQDRIRDTDALSEHAIVQYFKEKDI